MHVLVDILHPAHVHVFRHALAELAASGHEVTVTARHKEIATDLLDAYGIPYTQISEQGTGAVGLAREMVGRTARLVRIARQVEPTVMIGIMGPSITVAGRLLRIPSVVFYDTEMAVQTNRFAYRLADAVVTPDCYQGPVPGRHDTYPGYHELAYLHPDRFTPDPTKITAFGVDPDEPYVLVRFVSWEASHDRNEIALTADQKREIVETAGVDARVLISSESELPADLRPFGVDGPIEQIHHLLAGARAVVGESATMGAEAAVLGTPAVYIAKSSRGYIDDLERYGLVDVFTPHQFSEAVPAIRRRASGDETGAVAEAHAEMMADKVDVTSWMVDYLLREFS